MTQLVPRGELDSVGRVDGLSSVLECWPSYGEIPGSSLLFFGPTSADKVAQDSQKSFTKNHTISKIWAFHLVYTLHVLLVNRE